MAVDDVSTVDDLNLNYLHHCCWELLLFPDGIAGKAMTWKSCFSAPIKRNLDKQFSIIS